MFTGIIQHSGTLESYKKLASGARLRIRTTDPESTRWGQVWKIT